MEPVKQFESIIDGIQLKLDTILENLLNENALLKSHDIQNIDDSVKQKSEVFEDISQDISILKEFLQAHNLSFDQTAILKFLQTSPKKTQDKWNHFVKSLEACQEQNLMNGMLVMGLKNYTDKMLNIITQREPQTYHPSKSQTSKVSTREHKA